VKVGFDAKRLFNNFTGLGNYSRFVVKALCESYPANEYFLYSPKVRQNPETDFLQQAKTIEIKTPHGIDSKLSSVWRTYSLGNVAGKDGVQIFHGLSNELPLIKPKGLKTVVTIHDVIFKRYPQFYNPIDRLIYDWKFKKACDQADQIIAVSNQTAEDVIEFLGADQKKVNVIYQGCHPIFEQKVSQQQIEAVQKKYRLPGKFILNVGTIESRKNALVLLEALQLMKEKMNVVIVGRSTPYQGILNDYIEKNQLSKWVTFIHNAAFQDLPLIYRAANLFVYPSLFEGFGIPIVEAISCGVPVITSKGSCFSEAGGPDCWYVDSNNASELQTAIEEVLSNGEQVIQRKERSTQYIQRFQPKVIAGELMTLYSKLI
jgi:glycosyltransferase involved in cell wall biosynthesis